MKKGVGLLGALIQNFQGFFRWEDEQFNFALLGLTFDLIHDWQCSFACADHIALKGSRLHRTAVSGQILLEQRSDVRPERSFRDFARRWCTCSKRDESVPQFTTRAHSS